MYTTMGAVILNSRGLIENFEQMRENEQEKKIRLAFTSGAHIE